MKKTMNFKRVVSILAVIAIMLSFMCLTTSAASISEAEKSVVAVICEDGLGYGTGFAIGVPGKPIEYIVTNDHVVEGENYYNATICFDYASNDMAMANIVSYDEKRDVAILKLSKPTDKRQAMVLRSMKYVDLDDDYAAIGYPGNQYTDFGSTLNSISTTRGNIKKKDKVDGQEVYVLDLDITHGNSGGPLVNSKGEVVGINTYSLIEDNYAITVDEILYLINRDNLDIKVTTYPTTNWFLIIGGAALLLIIILVVVLIIVLNSRKNKAGKVASYAMESVPVVDNRRDQVVIPHQAQPTPGARVIALGGALNGRKFSVAGTVRMGRDASKCAIAFPVHTQGVSAVHCEITFDGAVCYVKDLNSSYGTFTSEGTKFVPNVPQIVRSGEKFYLASPDNTFEVRF